MADSKTRLGRGALAEEIASRTGLPKTGVESVLKELAAVVAEKCFDEDSRVYIPSLGAFSVSERSARKGLNPVTKQKIDIPAKRVLVFKTAKENNRVAA